MKGKKIVLVIFILLLLILIAAAGAYAYLATDLFKTPEQLFNKYLMNEYDQISEIAFKPFDEINEKMANQNSEVTISASYDMKSLLGVFAAMMAGDNADANTKIGGKIVLTNDIENKAIGISADAAYMGNYLIDGTVILSEDSIKAQVNDLGKEGYSIENKGLKKFAKKLGLDEESIENIPDQVEISKYIENTDNKEVVELVKTYFTDYMNSLKSKEYSVEKNVNTTANGVEVTGTNCYSLTLSYKELATNALDIYEKILSDENALKVFGDQLDKEKIQEAIDEIASAREYVNENIEDNQKVIISVYAKDNRTVKVNIKADLAEDIKMDYDFAVNGENLSIKYIMNDEYKVDLSVTNTFDGTEGALELSGSVYSESEDDTLDGSIIFKTTKTSDDAYKTSISVKTSNEMIDSYLEDLKLSIAYKFGESVSLSKKLSKAKVLNDLSAEDLEKEFEKAKETAAEFLEENSSALIAGIIADSDEEEVEEPEEEDSTSSIFSFGSSSDDEDELFSSISSVGKEEIEEAIKDALNKCLDEYKKAAEDDSSVNIGDYLNESKVVELVPSNIEVKLINGSTFRVEVAGKVYYAAMEIDGGALKVNKVTVMTESEYENQ